MVIKKTLIGLGLLLGAVSFAQTGKVGVNTSTPTEILGVAGTVRIGELPQNGAVNSIYTINGTGVASGTKNQTFTAENTVVADKNGVLGYVKGLPGPGSNTFTYETFSVNASNSSPVITLSNTTVFPYFYIIKDATTSTSGGYTIYVDLPNNIAGNTGRIIRFYVVPSSAAHNKQYIYRGNIGNNLKTTGQTVNTGSSIAFGNQLNYRFESVLTFYEIDGKWYYDNLHL